MTIEKAIEILTLHFKGHSIKRDPDFFNASFLGIEALKRLQYLRSNFVELGSDYLPSETKK